MLEIREVHMLLRRLGLDSTYKGFFITADAVLLFVQSRDHLIMVTKDLYPTIARKYETNWRAVERNIRTASALAWEKKPELLSRMAGERLIKRPTASRFLSILAHCLLDGTAAVQ